MNKSDRFRKRKEQAAATNVQKTFQAGMRTLHEAGPELKRAISGNLDEIVEIVEPMHRVTYNIYKFTTP